MSRPWKYKEPLTHIIKVRCTSTEKQHFVEVAEGAGLSVSEVLRRKLLGLRIPDKTQIHTLFAVKNLERQLRKTGGLIKHIYSSSPQGIDYSDYSKVTLSLLREQETALQEITRTLRKLAPDDH